MTPPSGDWYLPRGINLEGELLAIQAAWPRGGVIDPKSPQVIELATKVAGGKTHEFSY